MSCPSASVRLDGEFLKAWEDKISVNRTIFLFVFGISIPTNDLPSITSTTLTLLTESDLAISCAIPVILLALVPGAGCISNLVTTGPGNTDSTVASMPNSSSFVSRSAAIWFNSSSVNEDPSSRALSSNCVLGITALVESSCLSDSCISTSVNLGSVVFGKSGCLASEEITLFENDSVFSNLAFGISLGAAAAIFSFLISKLDLYSLKLLIIFFTLTEVVLYKLAEDNINQFSAEIINNPITSSVFNHEKLKERDEAGIMNMTRNIRLPIKPSPFDRFIKIKFPK